MSVLCDTSIHTSWRTGRIGITPFVYANVGPASYDLTVELTAPLLLVKNEFYLLSSVERIRLAADVQGQVHGRSSIGRLGILIHFTAGFIDPGFDGQITFEVMALAQSEILAPGDRIGQISFAELDHPAASPYHGRYQYQVGPTPSRFMHGGG